MGNVSDYGDLVTAVSFFHREVRGQHSQTATTKKLKSVVTGFLNGQEYQYCVYVYVGVFVYVRITAAQPWQIRDYGAGCLL